MFRLELIIVDLLKFNKDLEKYIEDRSMDQDPVLEELYRETHLKTTYPQMLSGPVLGAFLELVSKIIRPKRILEIGTFTGYSAICLARGLQNGGSLLTIESNDELAEVAEKYFNKSGLSELIQPLSGNALKLLPGLKMSFDLVFIDGDKEDYIDYYELVMDHLNPGGIIIADNVLWSGKVVDPKEVDPATNGIREFNDWIKKDTRVENVIISIRDGVNLIRKL